MTGEIKAGSLALDKLLATEAKDKNAANRSSARGKKSSTGSRDRWSKVPINVSWIHSLHLDLDLSAKEINHGVWNFVRPSTSLSIQNGVLKAQDLKAGLFGGQALLNATIKAPQSSSGPLALSVSSTMDNIALESLAYALSKARTLKASGNVNMSYDVNSNGDSAYALIHALTGQANLDGQNIILKGFDLAKMARGLAVDEKLAQSVSSLVDGATRGGQTQFDTIEGLSLIHI